jgi:hypothetical protein
MAEKPHYANVGYVVSFFHHRIAQTMQLNAIIVDILKKWFVSQIG